MYKKITVAEYLEIMGLPVEDKVSGFTGIAVSVSFDLYGCVQVVVNPFAGKDNKLEDSRWFDYHRLEITGKKRVMELPNFILDEVSVEQVPAQMKGPAGKPVQTSLKGRH